MKKIYFLFLFFFGEETFSQGIFCSPSGNIAIFSNYDGGTLTINVDTNVANLKIGITSYENDSVIMIGPYVNNVSQVIFAGWYNSNNVHCTPWPSIKSVKGVPLSIVQINFLPPAIYFNPYGYSSIICNTSCSINTSQGGCNTADQIAAYYFSQFGGSNLLFHYTRYGCWSGVYNLSDGGNCCAVPAGTGLAENFSAPEISISPNPADGILSIRGVTPFQSIELFSVIGNKIPVQLNYRKQVCEIDLSGCASGIYFLKISDNSRVVTKRLIVR